MSTRHRLSLLTLGTATATAVAAARLGELVRRRRSADRAPAPAPLPPLTTQSSPGQISDLQEAYGADMGPAESDR